jgi:uncharacterized membrane protein YkgB
VSRTKVSEVREEAQRLDVRVRRLLDRIGVPLLRISLGVVFFEVFVGACLVAGRLMRLALPLLVLQMAGTFLVLVLLPDVAFRDGNPLLLTVEGEFVIKNLVLLSAALVIGARLAPIGEGGTGSA